MVENIAIKTEHVSKTFKLPHEKSTSVKSLLISLLRGGKRSFERQEVLKDISFEIKQGEFFGIVGRNGSGKSTLLKILAGIYSPTNGGIHINGRLTPFIELGVGFNPELTGRENVFLNGALLGFNRKEMGVMYDDIVAFAEIERFMDQKLKNYSSGMQVRLAFSIAIRAESEILLIDEVLAVGDAAFQAKCFDVFNELKRNKRTIILVTHDMANVERFCDRALVIEDGVIKEIGSPHSVAVTYAKMNARSEGSLSNFKTADKKRWGSYNVSIDTILLSSQNKSVKHLRTGEELSVNITVERKPGFETTPIVCGLAFYNEQGVNLAGPNSVGLKPTSTTGKFVYTIPKVMFAPGRYRVTVALYDEQVTEPFDYWDEAIEFDITSDEPVAGAIDLEGSWELK